MSAHKFRENGCKIKFTQSSLLMGNGPTGILFLMFDVNFFLFSRKTEVLFIPSKFYCNTCVVGTCNTAGTAVVAEAAAVVVAVAVVALPTVPEAQTAIANFSKYKNTINPKICSAQHHLNFFDIGQCP